MKGQLWPRAGFGGLENMMCKWNLLSFSFVTELCLPALHIPCLSNLSGAVPSHPVPWLHWEAGAMFHALLSSVSLGLFYACTFLYIVHVYQLLHSLKCKLILHTYYHLHSWQLPRVNKQIPWPAKNEQSKSDVCEEVRGDIQPSIWENANPYPYCTVLNVLVALTHLILKIITITTEMDNLIGLP